MDYRVRWRYAQASDRPSGSYIFVDMKVSSLQGVSDGLGRVDGTRGVVTLDLRE